MKFRVDGLAVELSPGVKEATPLLVVHGQLQAGDDVRPIAERLSARGDGRAWALLDLPWHGDSDAPDDADGTRFGGAIGRALSALGWQRARVVGHSLGALAVLDALIAGEARLEKALLVGCPADFTPEGAAEMRGLADVVEAHGLDPLLDVLVGRWYSPAYIAREPGIRDVVAAQLRRNTPGAAARAARALVSLPPREAALSNLAGRLAFVAGGIDPVAPPEVATRLAGLAQGPVHVVDGTGHHPFVEDPAGFDAIVDGWLR